MKTSKNTLDPQLQQAMQKKDFEAISRLISQGAGPDVALDDGTTPLILAAQRGKDELVKLLIEKKADVNAQTKEGETALSKAAFNGYLHIVQLLVGRGSEMNTTSKFGYSPLFWAVCGAHHDIVKFLVEKGADIDIKDKDGGTPFMRAASALYKPAHVDILQYFLDSGADVNQRNRHGITPLMNAAMGAHSRITEILLKNGANVHAKTDLGETALVMACRVYQKENPDVVKMLMDHGADITVRDQWNKPLLLLAVENKNYKITKILLDAGLDPDENCGSALRAAAERGDAEIVRLLLNSGADVNLADSEGKTALMSAVSGRHNEAAKLLIHAGADVSAVTHTSSWGGDRTVLMFALGVDDSYQYERSVPPKINIELLRLLLQKGADADYENKYNISALSLSRKTKNTRIIHLFKR